MTQPQKRLILSLIFIGFIPCTGLYAAEVDNELTHQSLYGFKLSIVNMPISGFASSAGTGQISAPEVATQWLNFDQVSHQLQLSYQLDDFSFSISTQLSTHSDQRLSIEAASLAQALSDSGVWARPNSDYQYWRIGGAYQAMERVRLSVNFQQDSQGIHEDIFSVATELQLNPDFRVQFIGLIGSDASKGALLKTSYHF